MKTKYLISLIITFAIIGSAVLVNNALAQETNIQYPIKELGNCKDKAACKIYCDKPEHIKVCVNFAEKNNLMSKEEIKGAKKFIAAGNKGPGGCRNKNECENYCDSVDHMDECITFAEKNDLIPPEELQEAKKVQAAIKRGVKPPPCKNKKECDIYCDQSDHMEKCIAFGIEAGFIQGKELEDVQKMLAALKKGIKPPPCKGKEACDEYCSNPDNMEKCMTFAIEAGFMNEQEKADSQKMLAALKKGIKPPTCKGKEECDIYCSQDEHFEECMNFAEAAGFMNSEDAAMARKTKGKGPGDCKGKEECEAFCNNPDNQETCFNFAKDNGMIPEKDLKIMEEGKSKFKETLNQAPPEVLECLNSLVGNEKMEKFKSGAVMPPREIGDKMRECFEKVMGPPPGEGQPGAGGMIPPAGQTGPGGCKNAEECKAYCESHPEECQKFQPGPGVTNPSEQMMPQQAGPGGCKGPEECEIYCKSHPDECKNLSPGKGEQFAPGTSPSSPNEQQIPSGPGGPAGQPGDTPPTGPAGCQTPEQCQQMQNQIMPPQTCQGENCMPGTLPGQPGESPLPGENLSYPPQTQMPPEYPQPPINQQPPMNNIAPPPAGTPPPPSEIPPPPSSAIITTLLNIPKLLLNIFLSVFNR